MDWIIWVATILIFAALISLMVAEMTFHPQALKKTRIGNGKPAAVPKHSGGRNGF